MTGKMSMAGSQDEVLKQTWMTKRSQLKSRLSWTNYKERWFCLTRSSLVYYDGDDEVKRKEKGRIMVRDIQVVEQVHTHTHRHLPLFEEPNNIKNMELGFIKKFRRSRLRTGFTVFKSSTVRTDRSTHFTFRFLYF